MNTRAISKPRWATAADGDAPDTLPGELCELGEHLAACRGTQGKLFALRRAAETMHGFAAARFVTTVVIVVAIFTAVVLAV